MFYADVTLYLVRISRVARATQSSSARAIASNVKRQIVDSERYIGCWRWMADMNKGPKENIHVLVRGV